MKKKIKVNYDKVNLDFLDCKNPDKYYIRLENEEEIIKKCKYYESLQYPLELKPKNDSSGEYWVAEHPSLPGCRTHGKTKEEALDNLEDAKKGWIYAALCEKESIPEPKFHKEVEECSGKISLRVPSELHYNLLQKAKSNNVSLNQELNNLLSYALGKTSSYGDIRNVFKESLEDIMDEILHKTVGNTINDSIKHAIIPIEHRISKLSDIWSSSRGKNIEEDLDVTEVQKLVKPDKHYNVSYMEKELINKIEVEFEH